MTMSKPLKDSPEGQFIVYSILSLFAVAAGGGLIFLLIWWTTS